jgi:hypothetical protein
MCCAVDANMACALFVRSCFSGANFEPYEFALLMLQWDGQRIQGREAILIAGCWSQPCAGDESAPAASCQ